MTAESVLSGEEIPHRDLIEQAFRSVFEGPLHEVIGKGKAWLKVTQLRTMPGTLKAELELNIRGKDYWFPVSKRVFERFKTVARGVSRGAGLRYLQRYIRKTRGYAEYSIAPGVNHPGWLGKRKQNPYYWTNRLAGWDTHPKAKSWTHRQSLKRDFVAPQQTCRPPPGPPPPAPAVKYMRPDGRVVVKKGQKAPALPKGRHVDEYKKRMRAKARARAERKKQERTLQGGKPPPTPPKGTKPRKKAAPKKAARAPGLPKGRHVDEYKKRMRSKARQRAERQRRERKQETMANMKPPEAHLPMTIAPKVGLDASQVQQIIQMLSDGKGYAAIAKTLGISAQHAELVKDMMAQFGGDVPVHEAVERTFLRVAEGDDVAAAVSDLLCDIPESYVEEAGSEADGPFEEKRVYRKARPARQYQTQGGKIHPAQYGGTTPSSRSKQQQANRDDRAKEIAGKRKKTGRQGTASQKSLSNISQHAQGKDSSPRTAAASKRFMQRYRQGNKKGKKAAALVAKLKKQGGVRNPEALAAWIGRRKGGSNSGD